MHELPSNREVPQENPYIGVTTPFTEHKSSSEATPTQGEITVPGSQNLAEYTQATSVEITATTVNTQIGPITTIGQPYEMSTYGAHDLASLLASTPPETLPGPLPNRLLAYTPGRDDVIVRWNSSYGSDAETTVNHMQMFEKEVTRLRASGISILRRSVFVVPEDKHYNNEPTIYMAVERLANEKNLAQLPRHDPKVRDINADICAALTDYYANTPPGSQFILESPTDPDQYAANGTLFDYDPRLATDTILLRNELLAIRRWNRKLPQNDTTQMTAARIKETLDTLRNL